MSSFTDAIAAGLASIRNLAGVTVTYQRGDTIVEGITATIGQTQFAGDGVAEDVVARHTSRDFMIAVADLADFGKPQLRDRITVDGSSSLYEVYPPQGETFFTYSDANESQFRIHSMKVG